MTSPVRRTGHPIDAGGAPANVESDGHPGTSGIWTFVFIDMVVFGLFFLTFVSERIRLPDLFARSQRLLDPMVGLVGTLLLIASSWGVAAAVHSVRRGAMNSARFQLSAAMLLGGGFAVNKLVEYGGKLGHGLTPATDSFLTLYFLITGLHLLHVIGGLCFLGHCQLRLASEGSSLLYRKKLENVGLFWHFVDLVWLFIFPIFYLAGSA